MQIKSLTLKNFRGFKDTEITFAEGLTVLVGANGAGKSSVLDALAMLLSWAGKRIRGEAGDAWKLKETEIHAGATFTSAEFTLQYQKSDYGWREALSKPGQENGVRSYRKGLTRFADDIRRQITDARGQCSVPVMVYYRANRAVTKVPVPPPKDAQCFEPLETYRDNFPAEAIDFHAFFKWFRAREDLENETIRRERIPDYRDSHLEAVRNALHVFIPYVENLTVRRLEDALVAEKAGLTIRVDRLSDGEKLIIAIVGDIVRRLALANSGSGNLRDGEGVVLIDEIEQHLHPALQRTIIGKLRQTFPKVQFIVSTHSPQVLGEVEHGCIRCFYPDPEKGQQLYVPQRSLGLDSNSILEEVFDAGRRNAGVAEKLEKIFELIALESFDRAQEHIAALETELGSDIPDLIKAKTMIAMLEGSGAEHS